MKYYRKTQTEIQLEVKNVKKTETVTKKSVITETENCSENWYWNFKKFCNLNHTGTDTDLQQRYVAGSILRRTRIATSCILDHFTFQLCCDGW